jgi:hypothetical protein
MMQKSKNGCEDEEKKQKERPRNKQEIEEKHHFRRNFCVFLLLLSL